MMCFIFSIMDLRSGLDQKGPRFEGGVSGGSLQSPGGHPHPPQPEFFIFFIFFLKFCHEFGTAIGGRHSTGLQRLWQTCYGFATATNDKHYRTGPMSNPWA